MAPFTSLALAFSLALVLAPPLRWAPPIKGTLQHPLPPQVGTILLSVEDIQGDGISPAPAHLTAGAGALPHEQPTAEQVPPPCVTKDTEGGEEPARSSTPPPLPAERGAFIPPSRPLAPAHWPS